VVDAVTSVATSGLSLSMSISPPQAAANGDPLQLLGQLPYALHVAALHA